MVNDQQQKSRKRSWIAVRSLFLISGIISRRSCNCDASPFAQHHVPPAHRHVVYPNSDSRRTSAPVAHHSTSRDQRESILSQRYEDATRPEVLWHVHGDASLEVPDDLFEEIRRQSKSIPSSSSNTSSNWNPAFSFLSLDWISSGQTKATKHWNNSLRRKTQENTEGYAFVDESDSDAEEGNSANPSNEDGNETSTSSVGFNVSVDTEYNVSDTVIFDSNTNNGTSEVDSATVIFTSNSNATTTGNNETAEGLYFTENNTTIDDSSSGETAEPRIFRPLRMRAFLSELAGGGQHLNEPQRSVLMQQIIKPALLSWSAALRVEPVQGNLTVDSYQLLDGVSCGPGPNVVVPTSHLTSGVPDTDFILYISLAFVQQNATDTTTDGSTVIQEDGSTEAPISSTSAPEDYDSPASSTLQPSTEQRLAKQTCAGDYLAASAFCSTDQFDRPTAAILHLCIDENEFWLPSNLQANIMTMKHEIGHSLGFNGYSLAHFRRADGTPLTPRDPETGSIPLQNINCTGPIGHRQTGTVALPGPDILQFRTVRGGVRVAEVVTPNVRQVVRNHFDCPDLPGAELESGEFLPLSTHYQDGGRAVVSCIGDHWERRLFKTDLMNPLVDDNAEFYPLFSTITLAYFADSGWYQVDLSRASMAAGWGRAAGCDFVDHECIHDGQVPPRFGPFFCNQAPNSDTDDDGDSGSGFSSSIHGCTPDLSRKASCSLGSYEGELPLEYQYFNFSYGANVGGNDPFMDYCPVYAGFTNGLCSDPENEAVIKVNMIERFGQRNSRCLAGNLRKDMSLLWKNADDGVNNDTVTGNSNAVVVTEMTEQTALCLPIACVVEDRSLRIQIDGVWEVCRQQGDIIVLQSLTDSETSEDTSNLHSITCPDPIRICPTFYCRRDCLGTNRVCDYNVGKCVCQHSSTLHEDFPGNITITDDMLLEDDNENSPCFRINSTETNSDDHGSFYSPDEDKDGKLPGPDSPLADYYVPRARDLEENESFGSKHWKIVVALSVLVLCLAAIGLFYSVRIWRKRRAGLVSENTNDGAPINPEKHKMMASVVVNMRMNDPNLQRLDALGNRDSETDLSMTDTECTGTDSNTSLCSLELSTVPHQQEGPCTTSIQDEVCSTKRGRLNVNEDEELYMDPLAPPATEAPRLVRRRHRPLQSSS